MLASASMKRPSPDSFEQLYHEYWHMLYRRAMHIVGIDQDAQDVVQDVFASMWGRKDSIEIRTDLPVYLLGAVKCRSLAFLRDKTSREQHRKAIACNITDREEETPRIEARESIRRISVTVRSMPGRMREIYSLSRMEAMSHRQIAQTLDIEESTVKKQIRLALQRIRLDLVES